MAEGPLNSRLARIFEEHKDRLFASALAVTGCPVRAEDAVQEAFYRLFRLSHEPRHLKAYVFRAVRNAALDQRRGRRPASLDDEWIVFDEADGPAEAAERREFRRAATLALRALSEDERETIVNHLYAGMSFREIAAVRELSVNTVSSWYRRGMEKLRRKLGQEHDRV